MTSKSRWVALAALLVIAAVLWWTAPRRNSTSVAPADAPQVPVAQEALSFESAAPVAVEVGEGPVEREDSSRAAEVAHVVPEWPAPSFEYELELRVTGPDDLPAAGVRLLAAPAGHTLNDVGATDDAGVARLRWLGFQSSMQLDLAVGEDSQLRRLDVTAGSQSLALRDSVQRSTPRVVFERVKHAKKESVGLAASFTIEASTRAAPSLRELKRSQLAFVEGTGVVEALRDAEGRLRFVEPALGDQFRSASVDPLDALTALNVAGALTTFDGTLYRIALAHAAAASQNRSSIAGTVVDADGRALASVPVHVFRSSTGSSIAAFTDAEGEFSLPNSETGEFELVAGGGDFPIARQRLVTDASGAQRAEFVLDRGLELLGRLVDRNGAPLALWNVQVVDFAETFVDSTTTDAEGRFTVPQVPVRALRVLASPSSFTDVPPMLACASLRASSEEIALSLDCVADQAGAAVRFSAASESDSPAARNVRAWRLDTERAASGAAVGSSVADESPAASVVKAWRLEVGRAASGSTVPREFSISSDPETSPPGPVDLVVEGLPAGWYRVEALFDGRGVLRLDLLLLAAGDDLNLGAVSLPASGRVRFESATRVPVDVELVQRALDVELRCTISLSVPGDLRLPVGEYEMLVRSPSTAGTRRLTIEANSIERVQL